MSMQVGPFEIHGYYVGDCRALLRELPDESVHCVVTSPPYWGLRSYLPEGSDLKAAEIGLEGTPSQYVAGMAAVFEEVRRVLRKDGSLWLNLGDSFNSYAGNRGKSKGENKNHHDIMPALPAGYGLSSPEHKNKDLVGIPWRVAFALQAAGWYLRSDIIWAKPNPMPESVRDRPTRAHEYLFLLTKSDRYWYDAEAIREPRTSDEDSNSFRGGCYVGGATDNGTLGVRQVRGNKRVGSGNKARQYGGGDGQRPDDHLASGVPWTDTDGRRNKRSVWTIASEPTKDAHFATFPTALVAPCILAGCPTGGLTLDPFAGSGTVGRVAEDMGRRWLLFDLNPAYAEIAKRRTGQRGLL